MTVNNLTDINTARGDVMVDGAWIKATIRMNDEIGAKYLLSRDEADRLDAFETAARIGLSSLATADHSHMDRLMDAKLDRFTEQLNRAVDESFRKATDAFEERFTKRLDGDLAKTLDTHTKGIEEQFEKLFGASDHGVVEQFRRLIQGYNGLVKDEVTQAHEKFRKDVGALITGTDNPEHPFSKIDAKLNEVVKGIAADIEAKHAAIAGQAIVEKTGASGYSFQDAVHAAVSDLLCGGEDEVDLKGRSPGVTGGAEGDIVVTVDPDQTQGVACRVSVEVTKSGTSLSTAKIKEALKKGKADRSAQAAVLVVRSPKVLGEQRIQTFQGLGVALVYDPEDPEEFRSLALMVGLRQAKAMAVREAKPSAAERNDEAIERACIEARSAIEAVDTVLGNQAKIVKLADATTDVAKDLRHRVLDAVARIDDALAS